MVVTWGPCEQTDTCENITFPNIGSKIILLKLLLSATPHTVSTAGSVTSKASSVFHFRLIHTMMAISFLYEYFTVLLLLQCECLHLLPHTVSTLIVLPMFLQISSAGPNELALGCQRKAGRTGGLKPIQFFIRCERKQTCFHQNSFM